MDCCVPLPGLGALASCAAAYAVDFTTTYPPPQLPALTDRPKGRGRAVQRPGTQNGTTGREAAAQGLWRPSNAARLIRHQPPCISPVRQLHGTLIDDWHEKILREPYRVASPSR